MNMSGPFTVDHGGLLSSLSIEVNLLTNIMISRNYPQISSQIQKLQVTGTQLTFTQTKQEVS